MVKGLTGRRVRYLTHLPLVPHLCVSESNRVNIGSDNGLSPILRQAIISTNDGLLSIGPLGSNFSEILIKIPNFSFTKMHLKISSAKWRPFCPGAMSWTAIISWRGLKSAVLSNISSSPPGQNGRHFANYIFRCMFVNEKICILVEISLKIVPKGQIDNKSALV